MHHGDRSPVRWWARALLGAVVFAAGCGSSDGPIAESPLDPTATAPDATRANPTIDQRAVGDQPVAEGPSAAGAAATDPAPTEQPVAGATPEVEIAAPTPLATSTPESSPTPASASLPPTDAVRVCTVNVGFDEFLNVRAGPSLEARIVARSPGRSCFLTTGADLDAPWIPVRYETAAVRHDGFVSADFVRPAQAEDYTHVALGWAQAVLDGRDRSTFEYEPWVDEDDLAPLAPYSGGTAAPVNDGFAYCVLFGDVTSACPTAIKDDDGRVVAEIAVIMQGPNSLYGPGFFPDDFGPEPRVIGVELCPGASECTEVHFDRIVIDDRAALAGVPLGTPADVAVDAISERLGATTDDTGWIVGCPLDGEGANERFVEWGPITAIFARFEDNSQGELRAWNWAAERAASDPADRWPVLLPGSVSPYDSLDTVAAANRLLVRTHEISGEPALFGLGWTIFGSLDGERVVTAAVPFVPFCD
ncbi:MAG: hypothetical protein AAF567_05640 [Actinomycetota bacterium]